MFRGGKLFCGDNRISWNHFSPSLPSFQFVSVSVPLPVCIKMNMLLYNIIFLRHVASDDGNLSQYIHTYMGHIKVLKLKSI